jgi:hypothetical protein
MAAFQRLAMQYENGQRYAERRAILARLDGFGHRAYKQNRCELAEIEIYQPPFMRGLRPPSTPPTDQLRQ